MEYDLSQITPVDPDDVWTSSERLIYVQFTFCVYGDGYYCRNHIGDRLKITRLCLGLSHLHEHKFKHSFQDCLNPLCFCNNDNETSTHYLLHCSTFKNQGMTLLDKIQSINGGILELSSAAVKKILLVLHFYSRIIDKELY